MKIDDVMSVAASGLHAQSARMRVIAENIANSASTSTEEGGDPYRRRIPVFEAELDRALGVERVAMTRTVPDAAEFVSRYEPGHPAADAEGYVKYSNVNPLIEMMDLRAAQRAYEANLNVIESSRSMLTRTLDLLRR
ncbi:MAG: flagellar basal body rod protein FlgC [Maricaulaceae bacterium]|jgi:flagellar basal-body rod protein FlgC